VPGAGLGLVDYDFHLGHGRMYHRHLSRGTFTLGMHLQGLRSLEQRSTLMAHAVLVSKLLKNRANFRGQRET
jgi:hypothetical protein